MQTTELALSILACLCVLGCACVRGDGLAVWRSGVHVGFVCACGVPTPGGLALLNQFEALGVEAVALPVGHGLQQRLLLLGAAGRLQLVHGGQVEEDALVQVERRVLLHQALQLAQGLLETAQVQQAHGRVIVGLRTQERRLRGTEEKSSQEGAQNVTRLTVLLISRSAFPSGLKCCKNATK